jgi:hypothetical protein
VLDRTTIQDLLEQQVQIRANRTEHPATQQEASPTERGMPVPRPVLLTTDHYPRPA